MPDAAKNALKEDEIALEERPRETPVEFFASLAELLVIVLFIMTFVLQNFEIPSSSMEDTMLIGDHVFVNREQFAPPTRWLGRCCLIATSTGTILLYSCLRKNRDYS